MTSFAKSVDPVTINVAPDKRRRGILDTSHVRNETALLQTLFIVAAG